MTMLNQKTSKFGRDTCSALCRLTVHKYGRWTSRPLCSKKVVHIAQGERERQDTYVTSEPKRKLVPFSPALPKARAINQLQQEATKLRHKRYLNNFGR